MYTDNYDLPKIEIDLDFSEGNDTYKLYHQLIQKNLKKILPKEFLQGYSSKMHSKEEILECLHSLLPLTHISSGKKALSNMSIYLLLKYRPNAFKFFYEMISRWLIPGKRINVLSLYAVDFSMSEISNDVYTLCEVVIQNESVEEWEEVQRNLPIIQSEINLGVVSGYYARRILEIKGLASDEKTAMIQEYIASMVSRLPKNFSSDVLNETQHILVTCRDDFKNNRGPRHLSRIICINYLFRKDLREKVKAVPTKRYLNLKIFNATIKENNIEKKVLGLIVGVNFLKKKEVFEEYYLLKAIRNYIPTVKAVENSFFFSRRGSEPICTLYLEIEKSQGEAFTGEEIKILRTDLPEELEARIEHLIHPIFMPRNDEEIMRNILTLGSQVKYVKDIPQMFISFNEQTHTHLFFTLIIARIVKPGDRQPQNLFVDSDLFFKFNLDWIKQLGIIRKKYLKEALVFTVKVLKDHFLRKDHSIDLYKARKVLVKEINKMVGDVRDYNGGMITKQDELLTEVRSILKKSRKFNDLLLEDFFYSLTPVIMRSVLDPVSLEKLFTMLLETSSGGCNPEVGYTMNIRAEPNFVYVMIALEKRAIEKRLKAKITELKLPANALAASSIQVNQSPYIGYIYRSDDPTKQRVFCTAIKHVMEASK